MNEFDVIGYNFKIPKSTHSKLKIKCMEEGYSIQEGVLRLIDAYVNNKIIIKEEKDV